MSKPPYQTAKPGSWSQLGPAAKAMRKEPTPAERELWKHLRGDALGVNFRRQHVIDRFPVDFVCLSAQLIVEVDGSVHEDEHQQSYDQERDTRLTGLGYRIVRYSNRQVLSDVRSVLADIRKWIARPSGRRTPPHPDRESAGQ